MPIAHAHTVNAVTRAGIFSQSGRALHLLNGTDYRERDISGLGVTDPPPQPWSTLQYLLTVYLSYRKVASHETSRRARATIADPSTVIDRQRGMSLEPAEIKAFDTIALWQGFSSYQLACYLGVSESRVSSIMTALIHREALVRNSAPRGMTQYILTDEGIRYWTGRERAFLPAELDRWSNAHGESSSEWRGSTLRTLLGRERRHTDAINSIVARMAAELHDDPESEFLWALPARRGRLQFYSGGRRAILPDATVATTNQGEYTPFLVEYERSASGQAKLASRLRLYQRLSRTTQARKDFGALPWILFVFPDPQREETFVRAANDRLRPFQGTPPVLTSNTPLLDEIGILGPVWAYLWHSNPLSREDLPTRPPDWKEESEYSD